VLFVFFFLFGILDFAVPAPEVLIDYIFLTSAVDLRKHRHSIDYSKVAYENPVQLSPLCSAFLSCVNVQDSAFSHMPLRAMPR
jgi:hypothetical protein